MESMERVCGIENTQRRGIARNLRFELVQRDFDSRSLIDSKGERTPFDSESK